MEIKWIKRLTTGLKKNRGPTGSTQKENGSRLARSRKNRDPREGKTRGYRKRVFKEVAVMQENQT